MVLRGGGSQFNAALFGIGRAKGGIAAMAVANRG